MDQELKQLVGTVIKEANLFLSKQFGKPEDTDVAFLELLIHVSAIVKHGLRFHGCDPNNPPPNALFLVEISKGIAEHTSGTKTVARVLVDQHMKLLLAFTPLCDVHGVDCEDMGPINPPRIVSLKDLSLIGFNAAALAEGIRDTFEHQMSGSSESTLEERVDEDGTTKLFSHKMMRGEA